MDCKKWLSSSPSLLLLIDEMIDNTHPPAIGIHIMLFQKLGSRIDDKISKALQINGTYQILFDFSLTIKKLAAIIKLLIIWLFNQVSVCGVIIESEITRDLKFYLHLPFKFYPDPNGSGLIS
jgi:hypothetical protein